MRGRRGDIRVGLLASVATEVSFKGAAVVEGNAAAVDGAGEGLGLALMDVGVVARHVVAVGEELLALGGSERRKRGRGE